LTIFELVKLALDELYQEASDEYGDEVDDRVNNRIDYLSKNYGKLNSKDRLQVDYSDPATRFAYVFKYVATHGDYLVQALEKYRSSFGGILFPNNQLRVSCIGGGPGSDVIGVIKYLSDHDEESVKKVVCYLLDGEQAWADTWTEIGSSLDQNISVDVHFQPLDVTKPETWSTQKKFLKANVFTLSYFVSEIYSVANDKVQGFWQTLFDQAIGGATLIYVDNGHDDFNNYFDTQ
jgi:hypothetical protein